MVEPDAETTNPEPQTSSEADSSVENALADVQASVDGLREDVDAAAPPELEDLQAAGEGAEGIELLSDVDLDVMIELGRTEMLVEDVLRLQNGSVVELDKLAGDPVDVYVNGHLVARGEVLILNDNFCVRVSEIVANLEEQVETATQEELSQAEAT